MQSRKWRALAREATSAAEHILFGATTLGRANYAQSAHYSQAFFALTIGLERAAKLALVVDHALDNDGDFPSNDAVKKYGHRLDRLLAAVISLIQRRELEIEVPGGAIHDAIVETLTAFASNVTRYYNLDLVTDAPGAAEREDPIAAWYREVTSRVLAQHYSERARQRDAARAAAGEALIGSYALVRHTAESGAPISSIEDALSYGSAGKTAKRWERMYVMRIGKFVGLTLCELSYIAQQRQVVEVPAFSDMFGIFYNKDRYFRERATWSLYRS